MVRQRASGTVSCEAMPPPGAAVVGDRELQTVITGRAAVTARLGDNISKEIAMRSKKLASVVGVALLDAGVASTTLFSRKDTSVGRKSGDKPGN